VTPDRGSWQFGLFGAAVAIAVAGLLVPVRDWMGATNVALVLVVVIVAAASFGGRAAGVITSFGAAMALNYFHTTPYYTLRMTERTELVTVTLLFVVGLIVGELAQLRAGATRRMSREHDALVGLEQVANLSASGDVDAVWAAVHDALMRELGLRSCTFEAVGGIEVHLPVVDHRGALRVTDSTLVGGGFALPKAGVAIEVRHAGELFGHLVLAPDPQVGVTVQRRQVAVALAAQLASAMAAAGRHHLD
jgi:K+-sensing histidine kinase KdpD